MNRRILLLSASVGAGHVRAAQAVEAAVRELDDGATVKHVDVLELTNRTFRRVYGKTYFELVEKAPHLLGYLYDRMDRAPSLRGRSDRLRLLMEKLNLRPFLRFLREEPWDIIVHTHFLPAEMVASLKRDGETSTPHFIVTTDFDPHRLWVQQPAEAYFTATEEGKRILEHQGVDGATIHVTGIPIHPVFGRKVERAECLRAFGLRGDRPIVLQLAGGFGIGPVEEMLRSALEVELPLEVVVVAGRNQALRERLESTDAPRRHRVHVLGFTDAIDRLMAVADVIVSKPGGLTTSEALARGLPMAIVNPIPGQETRNSDFLLENGAAIKVNHLPVLAYKLASLLEDPARLASLKRSALRAGRPRAAFEVARHALEWNGSLAKAKA